MLVRHEVRDDAAAVGAVHDEAFGGPAEARLVAELHADGDVVLSFVAVEAGAVVGHVLCSRAHAGGVPLLGLAPLGVLPAHQGRGVGAALLHTVLGAAQARGESAVVLLGDVGYYGRYGFSAASPQGLDPPDPAWGGHFLARLTGARSPRGTVAYAPAFARL